MKQVIICPKCQKENKANTDICESCGANLIMVPPTVISDPIESNAPRYLICPVCGEKNFLKEGQSAGSIKFCKECEQDDIRNLTEDDIKYEVDNGGIPNLDNTDPITTASGSVEEANTRVVLKLKGNDNKILLLDEGTYVIGKAGDIEPHYFKNFRYVSREHARIKVEKGSISVNDVSTNGTFINGMKINQNEWVELNNGDSIRFADAPFEVSIC